MHSDETGKTKGDALEELVELIRQSRKLGFLNDEWLRLAELALHEQQIQWLSERNFRSRTGASDKWCRNHFSDYEANGLARKRGRHREWHMHARLPRTHGMSEEDLKARIVNSFDAKGAHHGKA